MSPKKSNRLINEKGPYLLQHAYNPVDWYPWGEEAFVKAQKEDKPVFLSIGYSTCHWCHVMEEESFENAQIANIMNDKFVSIKVDREERSDVDGIYMSAVMMMTGSGGWPLSVFLTADKKPFFGGTYFPPEARWGSPGFSDVLLSVHNNWVNQRDKILNASESLTNALQQRETIKQHNQSQIDENIFHAAYSQLEQSFDKTYGGFGQAPKFPMGHNLSFLLRYWHRSKDAASLSMVKKTLTQMAHGGIYDQIGGGFHRYSTDQEWQVPHFEKMLHDQAILAKAYLETYQVSKDPLFAKISREIFDYVIRDMQDKDGGFYSAEDADSLDPYQEENSSGNQSNKKEGAFYVWKSVELMDVLDEDEWKIFAYHFGIDEKGNANFDPHGEFIGKNIIHVFKSLQDTAKFFNKSAEDIEASLARAKQKLFAVRQQRHRPHLDDKVLVDWNGLLISSLAFGAKVLEEPKYLLAAQKSADFILTHFKEDNRLWHRYRDGEFGIDGNLEDYSFFANGLLDLYEATFTERYLLEAFDLIGAMVEHFWDEQGGGFFFTAHDSEQHIMRTKEVYDGAVPSGNSMAILCLTRLYHMTLTKEWEEKIHIFFKNAADEILQRPSAYAQLLSAYDFMLGPAKEIVVVDSHYSDGVKNIHREIFKHFFPRKVVLFRPLDHDQDVVKVAPFTKNQNIVEGKTTVYCCENQTCRQPIINVQELVNILQA